MSFIFNKTTTRQADIALLVLRVVVGLTIAAHGWQKVFVIGVDGVAGGFGGMGIPMASVAAPLVSYLELVGGIALAVGLLTRALALALAVDMLVAAFKVHLPSGFFAPKGAELTLLLAGAFVALTITGAGLMSIDAMINRSRHPELR